jgi:hypothetical protein
MSQLQRIQRQDGELGASSPSVRLYALLDTLVAVRIDLSEVMNRADGHNPMRNARLKDVRELLECDPVPKDIIELGRRAPRS